MNTKNFNKYANLCTDFVNILSDYAFSLDTYFSSAINQEKHRELYIEYKNLSDNIKNALKKNGFDKK